MENSFLAEKRKNRQKVNFNKLMFQHWKFSILKTHLYHFARTNLFNFMAWLFLNPDQDFSKWNFTVLKYFPEYPTHSTLSQTQTSVKALGLKHEWCNSHTYYKAETESNSIVSFYPHASNIYCVKLVHYLIIIFVENILYFLFLLTNSLNPNRNA